MIEVASTPKLAFGYKKSPFGDGIRAKCKTGSMDHNTFTNVVSLETCLSSASTQPDSAILYYLAIGEQGNGRCTTIQCFANQYDWEDNPEEGLEVYVKEYVDTDIELGWTS
eukprot:Awhi_evm1s1626